MSTRKTLLICLLILLVGGGTTAAIFMTEPTAERSGAVRETAMLVEVVGVEQGTFTPTIQAMGTVEPSQDIDLSPRVGGEILRVSEAFTPGGFAHKGEVLLQLDPADYENALAQRKSALSQAEADLNIELGRQSVARQDFELLGDTIALENRSLVLREPQLDAARSHVAAARAAVEQAELELGRTTIRAPFDAHILTRNANVGSQVAAGENLGRLVGLDTYWVVATVPQGQLRWLSFATDGATPSRVRVRNRTAWAEGEHRTGTLHRLVGALEDQTRLARVIVNVHDPLSYLPDNAGAPPLMIGSFLEASIEGKEIPDAIRLSRDYVRGDHTVWVMDEGVLRIREVDIVFQDTDYAYITGGLDTDAQVVITNLSTVVDGAPLRLEAEGTGDEDPLPAAAAPGSDAN
jgi:RND family efflux transporter MFP subunit